MTLDIGTYGEELYQQVLPMHGPDPDGLCHDLIGAYTHGVREIDELVRDTDDGPGWSAILDVDAAPVKGLYWLAQLAGVELRAPRILTVNNFIRYPDAETGLAALVWGEIGGDRMQRGGGTSPRGAAMVRFEATSTGVVGLSYVHDGADSESLSLGKSYTASVDLIEPTSPAFLRLGYTHLGTPVSSVDTAPATGGRLSASLVVPSSMDEVQIEVLFSNAQVGDSLNVDSLALRRSTDSDADVYFDGNSPGASWTGTPSESPSKLARLETDDEWAVYARDAIRRQGGRQRGTADSILSAAEDTLTGAKGARLLERVGGNPYRLELVTRPSETPDPALTLARAKTMVAAGRKLTHTLTEGVVIDEGSRSIDSGTATIDTATITDIAD